MVKLETGDRVRRWRRFELYECFLVSSTISVSLSVSSFATIFEILDFKS